MVMTLVEPRVPQAVVDAFERRYGGQFDLARDDDTWRNTWRYKHDHIQSMWEGWRDGWIAANPERSKVFAVTHAAALYPSYFNFTERSYGIQIIVRSPSPSEGVCGVTAESSMLREDVRGLRDWLTGYLEGQP